MVPGHSKCPHGRVGLGDPWMDELQPNAKAKTRVSDTRVFTPGSNFVVCLSIFIIKCGKKSFSFELQRLLTVFANWGALFLQIKIPFYLR